MINNENLKPREDDQWIKDLENEVADSEKTIKPVPWSDIKKQEFRPAKWRINNLLPFEGFVILAAVSGDRKSWLALSMAKHIALGENFLNEPQFATEAGSVLYLDMEMPRSELQRRGKQLGLSDEKNPIHILSGGDFNLNDDEGAEWLIEYIEENKITTVFIDTLRSVAGGMKEEKAEEVRTFFNRLKVLKDKGVVCVFLDHFRKPSHFEGKVPKKEHLFASQDKTACVEVLLMIQTNESTEEIAVYERKNRLGLEIPPFIIKMADFMIEGTEQKMTTLTYGGPLDQPESKREEAQDYIIECLTENESMNSRDIIKKLNLDKKVGERNVRYALKALTEQNLITYIKNGKQNVYSLKKAENNTKVDELDAFDLLAV